VLPALQLDALTCRFGSVVAVDALSLEVRRGEVFALLGHNGAGKTTTVRAANGVVEPAGGMVRVLGLDPLADGPALRRRTAVLTETASLDERLTARETLAVFAELYSLPRDGIARRVHALLESLDLLPRADDRVAGFSKGMRQRLALARALLHEPDVLFLDEPTSGLDPAATRLLHRLVRRLSREEGRTVVLCTHNLGEAETLCDRVAVLARGRLLACGTPAELSRRLVGRHELRVVVAPGQLDLARAVAERLPGMAVRAADDDTLVVAGGGADGAPALAAALVAAGIALHALVPVRATLADVYFALQPAGAPEPVPLDGANGADGADGEPS
jgi:ABC-2 type transport system ATP-binding protein